MTVSILDIASKTTPKQALALLLYYLETAGLPATAWQPKSVPRALLEGESVAYADALNLVAAIANGNILDLSAGEWLTQLAANMYQITRKTALFARGTVRVSNASGSAFSTAAGALLASSTQSTTAFRGLTAITALASGSFIDITFQAELAGLTGNVAVNTITSLLTPYPGISVSNPGTIGVWLSQLGTPDEDDVSLRIRCRARWPQLGGGPTLLAYQGWALSIAQVTRAAVFPNQPGDGKVSIVVAGATNPLPGTVVAAVSAYVTPKAGLCVQVNVQAATVSNVVVTATIYVLAEYLTSTVAAADSALRELVASKNIGETIYLAELTEVLMSVPGAKNVVIVSPISNTIVPSTGITALLTAPILTAAVAP